MPAERQRAISTAHSYLSQGDYERKLSRLVAIPSESQLEHQHSQLGFYCKEGVAPLFAEMGFKTQILDNADNKGGPFVIASRLEDPAKPTVLVYGHGDVVRGFENEWSDGRHPFTLSVSNDCFYGRGVSDNKGQHLIAMEAARAVLAVKGQLNFNLKFLIEMGEEIGSPGLQEFLKSHKELLAADVFIGVDGPRLNTTVPELRLGGRGIISFDLIVKLRDTAHHSGHWGGLLADPGFILAHALASIVSPAGKVLVAGLTPQAVPVSVSKACRSLMIEETPNSPMPDSGWGEPNLTRSEKIFAWSSVVVLSFITGHPDSPANAVQPEARARLQVRHTADVAPEVIEPSLRRHLDQNGFENVLIASVERSSVFPPARTDPENPWVNRISASLEKTSGHAINIVPNSSGGNPSKFFMDGLGVPAIWIPNSYSGCRQHAPDEHIPVRLVREGLGNFAGLFWDLGS